ncbi:hypothetical protein JW835_01920 [bacterium]|nr:hypothetical protein [bacterium]
MVDNLIKHLKQYRIVIFFILFYMAASIDLNAQTVADSTESRPVSNKSPVGAMIRSAIFPGWGQLYNGKWFKALLVVGIEAGLAGNAMLMNQRMIHSTTIDEREFYRHHRGTFVWWFAGVYLLNILDAFVDAHLFEFDVSPELGPADSLSPAQIRATLMLSLNLNR